MIKIVTNVEKAECDACKANLLEDIGNGLHNTNYGELIHRFGYGSRLDALDRKVVYHVCEDCWEKALKAIGILKPQDDLRG